VTRHYIDCKAKDADKWRAKGCVAPGAGRPSANGKRVLLRATGYVRGCISAATARKRYPPRDSGV